MEINTGSLKVSNENGLDPDQVLESYELSFTPGTLTVLDKPPALDRVTIDYHNETLSPTDASDVLYYSWDNTVDWSQWKKLESGMELTEYLDAAGSESFTLYFRTDCSAVAELNIPPRPATPQAPAAAEIGADSIHLTGTDGYEYSLDGKTWQDSPVFEGLNPETSYTIWQRVKATDTSFASLAATASFATSVKETAPMPGGEQITPTPTPDAEKITPTPGADNHGSGGQTDDRSDGGQSGKTANRSSSTSAVRTADETPAAETAVLMLAALAVIIAVAFIRRKRAE